LAEDDTVNIDVAQIGFLSNTVVTV